MGYVANFQCGNRKMLIKVILIVFAFLMRIDCILLKTTTDIKDIDLVDLLKQDLRRNNDDYIERWNLTSRNKQSGAESVAKSNVKEQALLTESRPNLMDPAAKRRNFEYSDEVNYNKYSFSPSPAPTSKPKRFHKVSQSSEPDRSPSTAPPELRKQDKISLFKQFIERNRDLIQDFVKQKRAESSPPPPGPAPPALRGRSSAEQRYATPSPRQLDMAPAKGGRIHSLRIKGRLCQRHVLMPEGPKYDSKGLVYLPAFARRRRDFPATRAPRLLLPRCCNCCRKSVLGCE